MAKTLIILILLFDGTLIQERYNLTREMSVHECLQYGDDHREAIAEYKEFKNTLKNGWYLKDGRGTFLLLVWNQEKPTSLTNKEKNEVGYGEKIKSP